MASNRAINSLPEQHLEQEEGNPTNDAPGIKYPGKHDVILGRGGDCNFHSGNLAFRHFIKIFKERYQASPKHGKPAIALDVVNSWKNLTPQGRFLARLHPDRGDSMWHEVSEERAVKRAARTLGERESTTRRNSHSSSASTPFNAHKGLDSKPLSDATTTTADESMIPSGQSEISEPLTHDAVARLDETPLVAASVQAFTQQQFVNDTDIPVSRVEQNVHTPEAFNDTSSTANSFSGVPQMDQELMDDTPINMLPSAAKLAASAFSSDESGNQSGTSSGSGNNKASSIKSKLGW